MAKKRVRKQWEQEHANYELTYVWGLDCNEQNRADRIVNTMIEYNHQFPLIERHLTKEAAHAICDGLGIKRPLMYDLGYNNNNCIGCVKGGLGYWNKIRVDFPEVFERRAKLERIVGNAILEESNGTPIYLDELSPERGRMSNEVMTECDLFCISVLPN